MSTTGPGSTASGGRPSSRRRSGQRQDWSAWLFIGPAALLLALTVAVPALTTLGFAFTDISFLRPTSFVGFQNFTNLLQDGVFLQSLGNTVYYTIGVTLPTIALGLGAALLLNLPHRGKAVFRAVFYLPVLVSIAAASLVWLYLYNPDAGPLNGLLQTVGLRGPRWLQNPTTVMPALIVMGIWRDFGSSMLLFLAGLQNVSEELKEAARLDGAGTFRVFWHVVLPALRPVTYYVFVLTVVGSFQVFGSIYIMTNGGPVGASSTIVHQIYLNAFSFGQFGYASAMSIVLFLVILVCSVLGTRFIRKDAS